MSKTLTNGLVVTAVISVALALPTHAQDTCDDFPQLSSCNTTPVGVCDAAAASGYVIEESENNWLVLPMADDPNYPDACSYVDPGDAINPIKATAKDDTNNLQCALDFSAAGRIAESDSSTITLEKGRYCLRESIIGMDFSGTIRGAGMHKTIIDIDDPVQRDANGYLNGEGGFRQYVDVIKSVVDPQGSAIDLHDTVQSEGDQPGFTKARRYWYGPGAAIELTNNRFDSRALRIQEIHFNVAEGTQGYTDTIHGFSALRGRPDAIRSIVSDSHVLGGHTTSRFGNSAVYDQGCDFGASAEQQISYNGASWYAEDTGVDLEELDPDLCLSPFRDLAEVESPRTPRNCPALNDCMPFAFDLATMPEFDTTFARVKATARNNTHNGLYYFISDRNHTFDILASEFYPHTFRQPVEATISVVDSVLRGLGSPLVGTLMDFSDTPLLNSTIELRDNTIGEFKEAGQTYACGRLWEGLDQLSGTEVRIRNNEIKGCQGGFIWHGYYQFWNERGLDSGYGPLSASAMPIPKATTIKIYGNDYEQGPIREGRDQSVASFFHASDWLNNNLVEEYVGLALPSLKVQVGGNKIVTTAVDGEDINPYWHTPIVLMGLTNSAIGANVITGAGAAAIAIGLEDGEYLPYDSGTRVVSNDLSGYDVVDCPAVYEDGSITTCSKETPEQEDAAKAKIWLGPLSTDIKVVRADKNMPSVGDLGLSNVILP
ncbi:MAG: hypothetical protein V7746_04935 [Halioglobus sp.]